MQLSQADEPSGESIANGYPSRNPGSSLCTFNNNDSANGFNISHTQPFSKSTQTYLNGSVRYLVRIRLGNMLVVVVVKHPR